MIRRVIEMFLDLINNACCVKLFPELWLSFFAIVILFYISKKNKNKGAELPLIQEKIIMLLCFIGIIGSFLFCLYFLNFRDFLVFSKNLLNNDGDYLIKAFICVVGFFLINLIYLYLSFEKSVQYEIYPLFLLLLVFTMLLISTFDVLTFFVFFEIFIIISYTLSFITKQPVSIFFPKIFLIHFFAIFLIVALFKFFLSAFYIKALLINPMLHSRLLVDVLSNFKNSEHIISSIFCIILFTLFVIYNIGFFPFNKWIVNLYEDQPIIITLILSCLQPIIFLHYLIKISFFFPTIFEASYRFIVILGLCSLLINAYVLPSEQMSLKRCIICAGLFQTAIAASIIGIEVLTPIELIYFYSCISVLMNIQMWYIYFFLYRFFGVDEESTEFKTGLPLRVNDLVDLYFTNKVWFCITLFPFFSNIIIFSKLFKIFKEFTYYDIFSGIFLLAIFFTPLIYYLKVIKLIDLKKSNQPKKMFLLSFKKFDFILAINFILLLALFCITIISFFFFHDILHYIFIIIRDQKLSLSSYSFLYQI